MKGGALAAVLLLYVVECQAWRTHRTFVVARGGAADFSDDDDDEPQQKKRKIMREIIIEEDEYDEWFEASQDFTEEEEDLFPEEVDEEAQYADDEQQGAEEDIPVSKSAKHDNVPKASDQQEEPTEMEKTLKQNSEQATASIGPGAEDDSGSSSADNVDRLELADAYDDDMAALTSEPPAIIDAQTERILKRDLKFSGREISQMKPAVAAVVAAKRLHRPVEGMPRNWYISPPVASKPKMIRWKRVLPRLIIPVAVGALAITQGESIMESIMDLASGAVDGVVSTQHQQQPSAIEEDVDPYAESLLAETTPDPVVHDHKPHSIKPGSMPDDEVDVTWLDKLLTAVERKVKAFLRWEI